MALYRFNRTEQLALLAASVIDTLNETYSESELDHDDNPPMTSLYNLASAVLERDSQDGEEHVDRSFTELIEYMDEPSAVASVRSSIKVAL